jgi:hypothetical protein
MTTRHASCSCGQFSLVAEGEPVRISICHCRACQRRTGSVFGTQARFPRHQVHDIRGRSTRYVRVAESGNAVSLFFCPDCGGTLYWELETLPGFVGVAVGCFADPQFPAPYISVYEDCMHGWAMQAGTLKLDRSRY